MVGIAAGYSFGLMTVQGLPLLQFWYNSAAFVQNTPFATPRTCCTCVTLRFFFGDLSHFCFPLFHPAYKVEWSCTKNYTLLLFCCTSGTRFSPRSSPPWGTLMPTASHQQHASSTSARVFFPTSVLVCTYRDSTCRRHCRWRWAPRRTLDSFTAAGLKM